MNLKHIVGIGALATAATITTVGSLPAEAATVFNFTNTPPIAQSSITFGPINGISVTATGANGLTPAPNVYSGPDGLGVIGPNTTVPFVGSVPDDPQVDGLFRTETLKLAFNQTVRLLSATFGRVGSSVLPGGPINDDFNLTINGVAAFSGDVPGGNLLDTGTGTATFTSFLGSNFDFSVLNAGDDYFIQSLTVEAIPTPALLPGLVGFGIAALRKRKAEATAEAEAEA